MEVRTIRLWAQKILSSNDMSSKLSLLKTSMSEIKCLPLGPEIPIIWNLPKHFEQAIKPTPEIKLLHSITHIELMAIYLYWDTISLIEAPCEFYENLAAIAIQECEHYYMLVSRLQELGVIYPAFKYGTHMEEFKEKTKDDILSRLLYISLYSEGRALDSKERLVMKLRGYNKDFKSADLLEHIINDEVNHLANGVKWFKYFVKLLNRDPLMVHKELLSKLNLVYRPPFNKHLRDLAGVPKEWYIINE